jgi:myosin I
MRDRRYNEYALILQKAFRKFNAVKYYQKLKLEASSILINRKERRKLTINRKFYADYIGLDNYPALRALLVKREKVEFAQKCLKIDRQFKHSFRDVILSNRAIYIIGRKEVKGNKKKIVVEELKRRIDFNQIDKIVLR